jgi:hypothetical protein
MTFGHGHAFRVEARGDTKRGGLFAVAALLCFALLCFALLCFRRTRSHLLDSNGRLFCDRTIGHRLAPPLPTDGLQRLVWLCGLCAARALGAGSDRSGEPGKYDSLTGYNITISYLAYDPQYPCPSSAVAQVQVRTMWPEPSAHTARKRCTRFGTGLCCDSSHMWLRRLSPDRTESNAEACAAWLDRPWCAGATRRLQCTRCCS